MSTKAFLKGVETWKKETRIKKEVALRLQSNGVGTEENEPRALPEGPSNGTGTGTKDSKRPEVSILKNIYWKELGILFAVWVIILAFQIAKNYTTTCSAAYWALNLLQIPVALVLYCACGIVAGVVGGLLGLGGGFILGPLFLELGIPPQVASATATFAMTFSSSMSVVEYYLLKRFPVPYALYFFAVATIAALVGQYVVTKVIAIVGRASLIIFVLAATIFVSAISLGGVGIAHMVEKIKHKERMGFESLCRYRP
ncbi:hypothetical protein SLA2020_282340 [Shorea laevis]